MDNSDFKSAISPEAADRDINPDRRATIRGPSPKTSVASGLNATKPHVSWFEPQKPAQGHEKPEQPSAPPTAKTRSFGFLKGLAYTTRALVALPKTSREHRLYQNMEGDTVAHPRYLR